VQPVRRWLEDGSLPILHAEIDDGDIRYHAMMFASLEFQQLLEANTGEVNLWGTHYLVAESFGFGFMHTEDQAQERERRLSQEMDREDETVLYLRVEALNTAAVPRYAWIKIRPECLPRRHDPVTIIGYRRYRQLPCFSRRRRTAWQPG
jgi:hypothetical protein